MEVKQHLQEVVEGRVAGGGAAGAALREQGRSEFGIGAQGHSQQLRVHSAQRVLASLSLSHGLRTGQTQRTFRTGTDWRTARDWSGTDAYLVDAARSEHDGGQGEQTVTLQQHAADAGLTAGQKDLSRRQTGLEHTLRV